MFTTFEILDCIKEFKYTYKYNGSGSHGKTCQIAFYFYFHFIQRPNFFGMVVIQPVPQISHSITQTKQHYKVFFHQEAALGICEPHLIDVFVSVPDLVADLLLVLLPVTRTETTEEDDGNNDEDKEYSNYGSCDDACGVGGQRAQGRKWLEGLVNGI